MMGPRAAEDRRVRIQFGQEFEGVAFDVLATYRDDPVWGWTALVWQVGPNGQAEGDQLEEWKNAIESGRDYQTPYECFGAALEFLAALVDRVRRQG